jgi:hypothetical protein
MNSKYSSDIRSLRLMLNPAKYNWIAISDLLASVGMRQRKVPQMRRAVFASL